MLSELGHPDDIDGWSLLRDALDVVETTSEYREELVIRLEQFLEPAIADAKDALQEASQEDGDADLPLYELMKLSDLAECWDITTEIDDPN